MKKIFMNYLLGSLWVLGLIIAGSENSFFPAVNFFGVFLTGFSSYIVVNRGHQDEKSGRNRKHPARFQKISPRLLSTGS